MPALRVFFFENGKARRLPYAAYDRLHNGEVRMPECAGKKVKYALVLLQTDNRKPVEIESTEFGILHFDHHGALDEKARAEESTLIREMTPSSGRKREGTVIKAAGRFANKRYVDKFKWQPSRAEVKTLLLALWPGLR